MTYVYALDHRHDAPPAVVAAIVGGKAANLADMSDSAFPVHPAFIIYTASCPA